MTVQCSRLHEVMVQYNSLTGKILCTFINTAKDVLLFLVQHSGLPLSVRDLPVLCASEDCYCAEHTGYETLA